MGLFEHFPYTNFHDLNLDVILQRVKSAEAAAASSAEDAADSAAIAQGLDDQIAAAVANSANAVSAASNAVSTANSAASNASTALSTANTAASNASTAVSTANTAASDAAIAKSDASSAVTEAAAAVNTANQALEYTSAVFTKITANITDPDNVLISGYSITDDELVSLMTTGSVIIPNFSGTAYYSSHSVVGNQALGRRETTVNFMGLQSAQGGPIIRRYTLIFRQLYQDNEWQPYEYLSGTTTTFNI